MKDKRGVLHRMALAGLMMGFFITPAYAGFEWKPPPADSSAGPEVSAVPPESVDAKELTPIPGEVRPPVVEELPISPEAAAPAIEAESATLPASPFPEVLAAPAVATPYATAVGFGSDIPLALAMSQIVPSGFAYSFAPGVNPGLKVSWNGGKAWNEVLNEALQSHDLQADIVGSAVVIRKKSDPEPMQDAAPFEIEGAAPQPPLNMSEAQSAALAMRGEGTAEKYPRRSAQKKNFLSSIFSNEPEKASQPPLSPGEAAAYEPAAALKPVQPPAPPVAHEDISYVDESRLETQGQQMETRPLEEPQQAFNPDKVDFWRGEQRQSLKEVLNDWGYRAGIDVIWDTGYDYKLPEAFSMHATFAEAVTKLFSLYGVAEPRPQGKLHPNLPEGPSVLVVENYP